MPHRRFDGIWLGADVHGAWLLPAGNPLRPSRVRADAAAVLGAVTRREPPFDEATAARWLARMRELVGGRGAGSPQG